MSPQYIRRQGITERRVDDVVFLVNPDNDALYHLNPVGTALWRLLEEGTTSAEAVELLCLAFPNAVPAQVEKDVTALLEEFADHNLILPLEG